MVVCSSPHHLTFLFVYCFRFCLDLHFEPLLAHPRSVLSQPDKIHPAAKPASTVYAGVNHARCDCSAQQQEGEKDSNNAHDSHGILSGRNNTSREACLCAMCLYDCCLHLKMKAGFHLDLLHCLIDAEQYRFHDIMMPQSRKQVPYFVATALLTHANCSRMQGCLERPCHYDSDAE